jgi:hypothetical protein
LRYQQNDIGYYRNQQGNAITYNKQLATAYGGFWPYSTILNYLEVVDAYKDIVGNTYFVSHRDYDPGVFTARNVKLGDETIDLPIATLGLSAFAPSSAGTDYTTVHIQDGIGKLVLFNDQVTHAVPDYVFHTFNVTAVNISFEGFKRAAEPLYQTFATREDGKIVNSFAYDKYMHYWATAQPTDPEDLSGTDKEKATLVPEVPATDTDPAVYNYNADVCYTAMAIGDVAGGSVLTGLVYYNTAANPLGVLTFWRDFYGTGRSDGFGPYSQRLATASHTYKSIYQRMKPSEDAAAGTDGTPDIILTW